MLLPDHTGGRAVFGNEPAQNLPAIFRESNSYYVLGFHPAHADGRFHDISVKVSRPGVILQARRGYYAAGAKPRRMAAAPRGVKPSLHEAIAGLWPKAGLGLTLTTAAVAMPGLRTAAVALMLGVEAPARDSGSGEDRPVNVLIGAFDREGRSLAYEQGTLTAVPRRGPDGRSSTICSLASSSNPGAMKFARRSRTPRPTRPAVSTPTSTSRTMSASSSRSRASSCTRIPPSQPAS